MLSILIEPLLESATKKAVETLSDKIFDVNEDRKRKASKALSADKESISEFSAKVVSIRNKTRVALQAHLIFIKNWSASFKLRDMPVKRSVSSVFIELDTYATTLKLSSQQIDAKQNSPLSQLLMRTPEHSVVLGQPGAGKSTSMQKVCSDYFINGKVLQNYNFPIVLRLRDLNIDSEIYPIINRLQSLLGIFIEFILPDKVEVTDSRLRLIEVETTVAYFDSLNCLIVLDGFDEIPDQTTKKFAYEDIKRLCESLTKSRVLVTSRTSDFPYEVVNAVTFEISPLNDNQIYQFSKKWFNNSIAANNFYNTLISSPYSDTALRPLTLAQLCAVYEGNGGIPEKPTEVSMRILNLLIEEWDSQRAVERKSGYAKFHRQRKREFLAALAYTLATKFTTSRFSTFTLHDAYLNIYKNFDLPVEEGQLVVKEIESHTGIIIESGYGYFEFAHKSLQEYLAAEYIVRLPSVAQTYEHMNSLANELAIATALSSLPSEYFAELVLGSIQTHHADTYFLESYIGRLCLEKPNFLYSQDAGIASALILTRCRNNPDYFDLLKNAFPHGIVHAMTAAGYYVLDSKNEKSLKFQLRKKHPRFNLVSTILIPQEIIKLN